MSETKQSSILQGKIFSLTGFNSSTKDALVKQITELGGSHQGTLDGEVEYLVAKSAGTDKHTKAAMLEIPVVTQQFISACAREKTLVDWKPYALPIFQGLKICVSGLEKSERDVLQKHCEQHGGSFSGQLDGTCTHLLLKKPEGAKYAFAVAKKILVLRPDWLTDSVAEQKYLDTMMYLVSDDVSKAPAVLHSQRHSSPTTSQQIVPQTQSIPSVVKNEQSILKVDTTVYEEAIDYDDESIPHFMEAVKAYFFRPFPKENIYKNKLIHCGGTVVPTLLPMTTHVIMSDDSETLKNRLNTKKPLVLKEWIDECIKEKRLVPFDNFLVVKGQTISTSTAQMISKPVSTPVKQAIPKVEIASPSIPASPSPVAVKVEQKLETKPVMRVFTGKNFILDASLTNLTTVKNKIMVNGGFVPPGTFAADYIVYEQPLRSPPTGKYTGIPVTAAWIDECISTKNLVPVSDSLLYSPIVANHVKPADIGLLTDKISVTLTGIHGNEKSMFKNITEYLGGTYFANLNRSVAILVANDRSESEKLTNAKQWGLHILKKQWLIDSAQKGAFQPVSLYHLFDDIVEEPLDNLNTKIDASEAINFLESHNGNPGSPTTPIKQQQKPVPETIEPATPPEPEPVQQAASMELDDLLEDIKSIKNITYNLSQTNSEDGFSLTQQASSVLEQTSMQGSDSSRLYSRSELEITGSLTQAAATVVLPAFEKGDATMTEEMLLYNERLAKQNEALKKAKQVQLDLLESQTVHYHESNIITAKKEKPRVLLSGLVDTKRYTDMLEPLGAIFKENFDLTCTHLIVQKPSQTEKYFCAAAAGLWILKPQFLEDCTKKEQWLNEEAYVWTEKDAKGAADTTIFNVDRWRKEGKKPFKNWLVYMVAPNHEMKKQFLNIISAGEGNVTNDLEARGLTHVIAAKADILTPEIIEVCKQRKLIMASAEYIAAYLGNPSVNPADYPAVKPAEKRQRKRISTKHADESETSSVESTSRAKRSRRTS